MIKQSDKSYKIINDGKDLALFVDINQKNNEEYSMEFEYSTIRKEIKNAKEYALSTYPGVNLDQIVLQYDGAVVATAILQSYIDEHTASD